MLDELFSKELFIDKSESQDLSPIFFGAQTCAKNHSFGPHTRNYYIIHFCLCGCGKLQDKFGEHNISAGQFFIIRPNEITTYTADAVTPWEYVWIAFEGKIANIFNTDRSVYLYPKEIAQSLLALVKKEESSPNIFISILYQLIYSIFSNKHDNSDVMSKVIQYINFNYMTEITVKKLSVQFGFEQSYLYRLFKKRTKMGIKEYIIKTRMEQAKALLSLGYTVSKTAFAVGYSDTFNFSKSYKKYFGIAPISDKNSLTL
jgi:AraC-like DNA-binding protein/quercetin dioxygenase-like cupin family protein